MDTVSARRQMHESACTLMRPSAVAELRLKFWLMRLTRAMSSQNFGLKSLSFRSNRMPVLTPAWLHYWRWLDAHLLDPVHCRPCSRWLVTLGNLRVPHVLVGPAHHGVGLPPPNNPRCPRQRSSCLRTGGMACETPAPASGSAVHALLMLRLMLDRRRPYINSSSRRSASSLPACHTQLDQLVLFIKMG